MKWEFEIIRDQKILNSESFLKYWKDLAENGECSHVFFHPAMVDAWLSTYTPIRDLEYFVVRGSDGENEALHPMVLWHKNWKNAFENVIVPVGYSDFDYHDPLFKIKPSTDSLSDYWNSLVKTIRNNFKFDSFTTDGITDNHSMLNDDWEHGEICPLLVLSDINNEDELMSFFKTSLRGDIRRQIRRLEEIAPLKYAEYQEWEDIPESTFSEFMRQHSMRWPNAYKAPHFHENLLKSGLESGVVHFSTLSVGDTEIAWHLGFTFRGRYYYYMPAGNQDFFKFSPTKIHLFYLVRRAVELNYDIYDHLRGEENYKSGWSNRESYVSSMTVRSDSMSAKLKSNLLKLRSRLGR